MCANNVRRACSGERDQALCKGRGARAERLGVTPRGESADYGPRGESADFGEQLLQEMPPSMFDCDEVPINQSTVLHHAEPTACSEVDGLLDGFMKGRGPQDATCDRWQLSNCSIFGYGLALTLSLILPLPQPYPYP